MSTSVPPTSDTAGLGTYQTPRHGRPSKLALVLSAGANSRLNGACPPGGKAQVDIGDGTTPWTRTRAMLRDRGWHPLLVELSSNQSRLDEAIHVQHSYGPAWAVREALRAFGNINWSNHQLLVWYGDTVLTEWAEPHTHNYTVCATEPLGVGLGEGRGYEREWDWGVGFDQPLERGRGSSDPSKRGRGSSQPRDYKVDLSQPGQNWPCVGIYHFRDPRIWCDAFDHVLAEATESDPDSYSGLDIGMVPVANRYAEIEKQSGALRALQVIDVATWMDVGDVGSLEDVRALVRKP